MCIIHTDKSLTSEMQPDHIDPGVLPQATLHTPDTGELEGETPTSQWMSQDNGKVRKSH